MTTFALFVLVTLGYCMVAFSVLGLVYRAHRPRRVDPAPVLDFADERARKRREHSEWLNEWRLIEQGGYGNPRMIRWAATQDVAGTSTPPKVQPPKVTAPAPYRGAHAYEYVVDMNGVHVPGRCRCGGHECTNGRMRR